MTAKHDDHSLVGAYAMDALDDHERQRFEGHLARCRDCTDELSSFVETTARLAAATPASLPASLRSSTMAAAARTRQLAPLRARDSRLDARKIPPTGVRRLLRAPNGPTATARPLLGVMAVVAIVLLAVAAGIFAGALRTARHRLDSAQRNEALLERVVAAPDAAVLSAPMTTGGTAHVVMASSLHALIFSVSDFRPLARTECYELWLIRGGREEPGGTLRATTKGLVGPIRIGGIHSGDALGVSVEPEHGSPVPTAQMIAKFARL